MGGPQQQALGKGICVIVLVHQSPTTLAAHWSRHLGVLSSPRRFYSQAELGAWPWAADNDAYSEWDPIRYNRMLEALADVRGCLFVTAPDVVGDWIATLYGFEGWYPVIAQTNQPISYVLQDGQPSDRVPWDEIAAVFVGGSDTWKMGEPNRELVTEAKERGKWVHMGRVNGHRRVRYAKAIGCDSFDGSSLSWFRDTYLDEFVAHATQPTQMMLDA